jgi:hypothetical protein
MSMAMLVGGRDIGQPVVGPVAVGRLAALGITRISLLGDQSGFGVVLEGWAFDPGRIEEAVRVMFPDRSEAVRVFGEIEQVAVAVAAIERSSSWSAHARNDRNVLAEPPRTNGEG